MEDVLKKVGRGLEEDPRGRARAGRGLEEGRKRVKSESKGSGEGWKKAGRGPEEG